MIEMLTGPNLHPPLAPFPRGSLELIAAVIGAGAPDPRTRSAAAALQRRRWRATLEPAVHWGRAVVARGEMRSGKDATLRGQSPHRIDAVRRLAIVSDFSIRLADRVSQCLLGNRKPLVIGGDHSCAIGTWSGVARYLGVRSRSAPLGLLWIDAHLDAHTPRSSDSKMPHGMPLAVLLGEGPQALTHLAGEAPVLQADRVVVLGARSWEPAEARRLERLGVRVISADEVRARGLSVCMTEALRRVRGLDLQPWGLSLDVDALDPQQMPATGTPVAGGLQVDELAAALQGLAWAEGLQAMELAEYNPRLDPDCHTACQLMKLLTALIGLRAPP